MMSLAATKVGNLTPKSVPTETLAIDFDFPLLMSMFLYSSDMFHEFVL